MTRKLAVIPARGGSTRLKEKNIYPLGDKPLIRWSVEAVVNSNCFDKIIISTDSNSIFDAVQDLPVERHCRPEEHSTAQATALNAMLNLMEGEEEKYDIFSYFLPTCPFVSVEEIQNGMNMLDDDTDFVVSMMEMQDTVQLACLINNNWILPVFDNLECGLTNSKFIKKYYRPSGAFYMGWWDKILENRNFFTRKVKGVMIPPERSVDINTLMDLKFAEQLLKG